MRLFELVRDEDITGVSGVGAVAEGVEFTDGTVCLHWRNVANPEAQGTSHALWTSVADMMAVHGHHGATRVVYLTGD